MKHFFRSLSLALALCLSAATLHAQNVVIPDANFKYALLHTTCSDTNGDGILDGDVDTNNDGEIQVSEAAAVTYLSVKNQFITLLCYKIIIKHNM